METGDLITLYRKQAGLTIDELADKSGVPIGTLKKIIGGVTKAPTLPNMKAIAKALGKTLADFDDQSAKKSPNEDQSTLRDNQESIIMNLVHDLDDAQQDFLIALLKTIQSQNQQRRSAEQAAVDDKAPESELHDQT